MHKSVRWLSSLFGGVPTGEAKVKVHERLTIYRDGVKSYVPHIPYSKQRPDLEVRHEDDEPDSKPTGQSPNLEQNQADAERKAVQRVKDYARWNQFDLFATFTFKADRQDVDKCFNTITNWFKNEQKRRDKTKGKIEYVIVPEFHKDSVSLHFHALIKNYHGEVRPSISPNTGRQIRKKGRLYYEFPSFRSGFTNAKYIDDTPESHAYMGKYLSKYITKDMPTFPGRQRYRVSKGLELPPKFDNPKPDWHKDLELVWFDTNEYGSTSYYKQPKEVED